MAIDAHIIQYKAEYLPAFQREESALRTACFQEVKAEGKSVVFLVSGTPTAAATERGANGLIVARQNSNTQNICTLVDINDLVEGNAFNWDLSQANQRLIAAQDSAATIHRKIDDQIVAQFDTATVNTGAAATASLSLVQGAIATLGLADVKVENENDMFALFSMKARSYLYQIPEFTRADYVEQKVLNGAIMKYRRWAGLNWIFSNGLTGKGTASEKCYIFHRNAMGHAMAGGVQVAAGKDEKQNQYWARTTVFAQAKLLQDSGIVQVIHNGL